MFDEVLECVICEGDIEQKKTPEGKVYWNQGDNAEPYAKGRCCSHCHSVFVLPTRMEQLV